MLYAVQIQGFSSVQFGVSSDTVSLLQHDSNHDTDID